MLLKPDICKADERISEYVHVKKISEWEYR